VKPGLSNIAFDTLTPGTLTFVGTLPRGQTARSFLDALDTAARTAGASLDRRIASHLFWLEVSGQVKGSEDAIRVLADVLPDVALAWGYEAYALTIPSEVTDA
jgi:hypothetical protein